MNPIAEEMMSYYGIGESENESLMHYGKGHLDGGHSGRYAWGSGEDSYQRANDFLDRIDQLKKSGWKETPENIMDEFGMNTTMYRSQKSLATNERRSRRAERAKSLKEEGLGETEIARMMSNELGRPVNESTVRSWLNESSEKKMNQAASVAEFIKGHVDQYGSADIGAGVDAELRISREKLRQATDILEAQGYVVLGGGLPQVTNPGQQTNLKYIFPPDTPYRVDEHGRKVGSAIYDLEKLHSMGDYVSRDGGETFETFHYPTSIDSSRVKVLTAEEIGPGGVKSIDRDGLIMLRRNVPDLSLGESRYSQVRILVDGNKYLKGMAVYSDDLPDGVDVLFNSNKKTVEDAYKKIKNDPENPFGSAIKEKGGQYWYTDENGEKKLGAINKRSDEGDWTDWQDKLPAQFLSKQSLSLAKKQLNLAAADKKAEFDEINSLTNPTLKKYLLGKFADECDSAAENLQAAALPGQKYHVMIPINSLKDNEVFAPGYESGTKLALVRYPHGGTFEIPILTVNNKNKDARDVIGMDSIDAVGLNKKNADRLSGADFDGDTVMCIPTHDPTGRVKITSVDPTKSKGLQSIVGFDTGSYGADKTVEDSDGKKHYFRNGHEYRIMNDTQKQMGVISNLITDMTLLGATDEEKARAVKHSMVVIDAEKHKLDYKQSEMDNDIAELKRLYQVHVDDDGNVKYGGAATLISKSKSEVRVDQREGSPKVNMKTKKDGSPNPDYDPTRPEGALVWKTASDKKLYYDKYEVDKKTGEVKVTKEKRTQGSTKMAETDDARTLISKANTPMENLYADYANSMKGLANTARKTQMMTGKIEYDAQAKVTYINEYNSLMSKLNTAELNRPKERRAEVLANISVRQSKDAVRSRLKEEYPSASNKEIEKMLKKEFDSKKAGQKALTKYRTEVGSVKRSERNIKITPREWEAIQAGAISESRLNRILANTDTDVLRGYAMPKSRSSVTPAKAAMIKAMRASNYSINDIAKKAGVSTSTIYEYLNGKDVNAS